MRVTPVRFLFLMTIKYLAKLLYRFECGWVGERPLDAGWRDVRLAVLLNHTSLFEPIFLGALPTAFLWSLARRGGFPGAAETMSRPIAGKVLRLLVPRAVSITRRRDESWESFLGQVGTDTVFIIAPEGRMKRPDGLDKHGRPMTLRGGIVDMLLLLRTGTMLVAYSGGLHHVQEPGGGFPKIFKTLTIRFEALSIDAYLAGFSSLEPGEARKAIVKDLQDRRDRFC